MNWMKIMWAKKVELLSSRKFWLVTLAAVAGVLKLEPITFIEVMEIVQQWLLVVASIGLVQGVAERIGSKK